MIQVSVNGSTERFDGPVAISVLLERLALAGKI